MGRWPEARREVHETAEERGWSADQLRKFHTRVESARRVHPGAIKDDGGWAPMLLVPSGGRLIRRLGRLRFFDADSAFEAACRWLDDLMATPGWRRTL